jgi:RibD C-terminal domain
LIDNDLIDEYRLWFFPIVLGTGKRLFGSDRARLALNLIDTQTTGTGIVINTYHRVESERFSGLLMGRLSNRILDHTQRGFAKWIRLSKNVLNRVKRRGQRITATMITVEPITLQNTFVFRDASTRHTKVCSASLVDRD